MKNAKGFLMNFIFIFFLCLLFATATLAQTTGSLQGIVKDPNGAVVAGASVKVTNSQTGQVKETVTNSDGFYRVTNLIPGDAYNVEVAANGFETKTTKSVSVRLGVENGFDVELPIKGASAEVTVTGEAPLINTTQNQLSTSYSTKQLQELPYNGGSIDNLALLTPGVVTPGDTDFTNGVGISANGNRGRSNNFQLDGQDNNDNSVAGPSLTLTNTEAIGDYQVTTNNPSAEFGRNSGAQINTITKNGTNDFHGSLFEYYQNSALNTLNNTQKNSGKMYNFLATNGFPELTGLANRKGKDLFSYHRFGGSIGGPIIKNKAFFFFTYQGDNQTGELDSNNLGTGGITFTKASAALAQSLGFPGATNILTNTNVGGGPAFANVPGTFYVVPALQDSNGDGVPDDFVTGGLYNSLFVCTINPGAGNDCPAANLRALQTGEVIRVTPNRYREHQFITREDLNLTDKDIIGIRFIYDTTNFPNTPAVGTIVSGAFFDVPSKNYNLGTTYTRTVSSNFTNEFRFNFSRLDVKFGDPTGTLPGPGIAFGGGQRDLEGNFTSLGFGTANNLPQSRIVDVYQEQDTISATLGNHSIRAGIDLRQQKVANFFLPNFLGVYRFNQAGANPANAAVCPTCNFYFDDGFPRAGFGAVAFENLLLGRPDRITFALGDPNIKTTQNDFFFFFQDDWRVMRNLTLNLGLRYEYSTTPFNPIIEKINAREASASTAIFDTAFPLSSRTASLLPNDTNNWAPRVGFAWSPDFDFFGGRFSGGKTVIRGGFGVSYDPSFFNIVLNTVTAAPFAAAGIFNQTPGAAGSLNFPFKPTTVAQLNTTPGTGGGNPSLFNQTRVSSDFHNPYTLNWNFGIQQEIFKDSVLEVRYVGTKIKDQFQTVNGNPSLRVLQNIAQCFGLAAGTFTNGNTVGPVATSTANACNNAGYRTNIGINDDGRVTAGQGITRTRTNGASGSYHGLQTRFDTRFSDIVFNANYTWSKTIDNASEIFSTFGGGQTVAQSQNPFDTDAGERGLSAFHQKHNFTANFIYELPFYKEQSGWVGKLLGGYQISGIIRLASGRPYTPQNAFSAYDPGFENAFIGAGALRPYNGNPNAPDGTIAFGWTSACQLLFADPACFSGGALDAPGNFLLYNTRNPGSTGTLVTAAQALQQARLIYNDSGVVNNFGLNGLIPFDCARFDPNLHFGCTEGLSLFKTPYGIGRNTFFGDAFHGVNLALFKTTRINERFKIEFRAEATNVLNSRNFGVPDPFTEDAFGSVAVSSYQNPGFNNGANRQLRFGLRFLF